jgi:hypothetical protein
MPRDRTWRRIFKRVSSINNCFIDRNRINNSQCTLEKMLQVDIEKRKVIEEMIDMYLKKQGESDGKQ